MPFGSMRLRSLLRKRTLILLLIPLACVSTSAQQDSSAGAKSATAATSPADKTAPSDAAATADLQKAVQNPVASLISVPVQNNSNFNYGPYNRTQDVLNIQPVIPARI